MSCGVSVASVYGMILLHVQPSSMCGWTVVRFTAPHKSSWGYLFTQDTGCQVFFSAQALGWRIESGSSQMDTILFVGMCVFALHVVCNLA